jgi:hypothetical protein
MLGISLHLLGEHPAARRCLEHFLYSPPSVPPSHFLHRASFDLNIVARYMLAHILWVQGHPDAAMDTVRGSVEEARRLQNPHTLCSALGLGGCALCLQTGDLDIGERWAAELVGYAQRYALGDFLAYGKAMQEILSLRRGKTKAGAERFRVALQRWRASGWHIFLSSSDLAGVVADAECADEILPIIDEELESAERDQTHSTWPETLRMKGELLLLQGDRDLLLVTECFKRSLDRARAQGALSWELRTALSLARLERTQGRAREARQLLQSVYDRFTEGFDTSDLKCARQFLDELSAGTGRSASGKGANPPLCRLPDDT